MICQVECEDCHSIEKRNKQSKSKHLAVIFHNYLAISAVIRQVLNVVLCLLNCMPNVKH